MSLGQSLQKYTYQYLLDRALSQIPGDIDKREGSIIYDALAPACYLLAEYFMEVHRLTQEVSIETASGEWLDNKVLEVGITRNQATSAVKKAIFTTVDNDGNEIPLSVPIGSRFASVSESQALYYVITDNYRVNGVIQAGEYEATCETPGIEGDRYTGTLVPLDFIPNLASAILSDSIIPGSDTETDEALRERYLTKVRYRAFGGNVAQYREMVLDIEDGRIGGVQVYPTWNGAGTVKLSIIDGANLAIRDDDGTVGEFVDTVQKIIDPAPIDGKGGQGLGLGLAPIGHIVTVVTPEQYIVDITADIRLSGKTIDQVKPEIEAAIEAYFAQLRADWDNGNDMNEYSTVIYQSQIVRAALSVTDGVSDFSNVVLRKRGTTTALTEITLEQSGTKQELPILGTVTLNDKS